MVETILPDSRHTPLTGLDNPAILEAFFDGFATKEQTIDRLRMQQPNLQMCFRTAAALRTLSFAGEEQL